MQYHFTSVGTVHKENNVAECSTTTTTSGEAVHDFQVQTLSFSSSSSVIESVHRAVINKKMGKYR